MKQGTVLDRIDFNVEQACFKTEDGLKQLQKVMTITEEIHIFSIAFFINNIISYTLTAVY